MVIRKFRVAALAALALNLSCTHAADAPTAALRAGAPLATDGVVHEFVLPTPNSCSTARSRWTSTFARRPMNATSRC